MQDCFLLNIILAFDIESFELPPLTNKAEVCVCTKIEVITDESYERK
jgi:hypothetical protein